MFAFLVDHRQVLFPDGEFEDLFPSGKGRLSIPASVMALDDLHWDVHHGCTRADLDPHSDPPTGPLVPITPGLVPLAATEVPGHRT
jgi:hypothetical protein